MTKESKGLGIVNSGSGAVAHSRGVGAGQGGAAIGGNLYGDLHLYGSSASSPTPCSASGIFFGVPELPPNYLPRKKYLDKFRVALQQESIGLTGAAHVGVQGMGGLGKSVLAIALARDEEVQAAFPDGIFWLTFGQEVGGDELLAWQNTILKLLGQQEPEDSLDLGRHRLNEALRDKCCLFIIDDIWDSRHLKPFDLSGTDCRFLLTSRKADVLERLGIEGKPIELLSKKQALAMLARYSAYAVDELPEEAAEIVKECGYLPLAVAAIGSMVKKKPADRWQLALRKLQEAKLDKIKFKFEYQYESLFRALQVSVETLPEAQQHYYKTLALFSEDALIPESVIVLYWEHCAFSDDYPQDLIDDLVDASLLIRVDNDFLRLHDLLRDYLISQTADIATLHKQLLAAYKAAYPGGWHTIPYTTPIITCSTSDYFTIIWHFHATSSGDYNLCYEIADNLIRHQPKLNMNLLQAALKFVDYDFVDIAPHLLKVNKDRVVLEKCLDFLGEKAKKEALRLLQERSHERQYEKILIKCLEILGKDAKNEAACLIKENVTKKVLFECLKVLGEDGKEHTWRFLRETKNFGFIEKCLFLLGDDAKEYAQNLLKETDNKWIRKICINFLERKIEE